MSEETTNISLRCPATLDRAISELAHQGRTSKSEIIRSLLTEAIEDRAGELPDHLARQLERERAKEQNTLRWQRIHFPSNVADRFRRAFEQGDLDGRPEAVEELRDIHREDAQILFDNNGELERALDYVDAIAEHAREAADTSDFDRLEPSEMFSRYSGVEAAEQADETDDLVEAASKLIDQDIPFYQAARSLSATHGVKTEEAARALDEAEQEVSA